MTVLWHGHQTSTNARGKRAIMKTNTRRNGASFAFRKNCLALLVGLAITSSVSAQQSTAVAKYAIPSGDLIQVVNEISRNSGFQIVYDIESLRGLKSIEVSGNLTLQQALDKALNGTGLTWTLVNPTTVSIRKNDSAPKAPASTKSPANARRANSASLEGQDTTALPAILVKGSRSLNTDIFRSEDDIQPYVVFDREEIEQSLALNIEEFLNTRLPMNASRGTASRNYAGTNDGNRSSFDLRGLGANQTLILINGRRAPGVQGERGTDLAQPDVNGIPIAAIERIEVLPTTASGIYGGGATGGVINIILRKDYQGTEIQFSYDNSFDTDSARRRFDASTGFSLEGGRTQVMVSASYSDANDLLVGDRDFASRARAAALANDPAGLEFNSPGGNRTNFRSVDGTMLSLINGTTLGTFFGSVPVGYLGDDDGSGLLAGAGVYDFSIPQGITGARQSLVTTPTTNAFNLTVRREMSSRVDAYLDAGTTQNRSVIRYAGTAPEYLLSPGDPGNPFNNLILFAIPAGDYEAATESTSDTLRLNSGLIISLPSDWSAGLDASWNRSTNKYAKTYGTYDLYGVESAFAAGTLNPFRDVSIFPLDLSPYLSPSVTDYGPSEVSTTDFAARIAGPAFALPAGKVNLSALASYRRDTAESNIEPSGTEYAYYPKRHQDVTSLYVEAMAPLVAPSQEVPFVNALEMQASLRWDSYKTVSVATGQSITLPTSGSPIPPIDYEKTSFDSVDYTLGFRYRPIEDVAIRASHSTGFLPPSIAQIASLVIEQGYGYVSDPKRGGQRTFFPARNVVGGNPDVQAEQSKSVSAGIIYTPSAIPGLRLSVDYTRIKKRDEIATLSQQEIVNLEDIIPDRIIRGPVVPSDPPGYAGPITSIDTSVVNISASRVEAYDFQVNYDHYFENMGDIQVYAVATRQTTLERQVIPTSPMVDRVGFSDGPLKWRGNIGIVWRLGNVTLAANTQFYDKYKVYSSTLPIEYIDSVTRIQGGYYVDAQSYTDVSARYVFSGGRLNGAQVSLGIRNLFDQSPPVVAGWQGTDGYSTFGDPRMRTYAITLKKTF